MNWDDLEAEQELQAEVDRGARLAQELVEHLLEMGAASACIPVGVDGACYEVIVRRV